MGETEMNKLASEVVSFACAAGIVPITRGEMYRLAIMWGETAKQADASAFAPYVRALDVGNPGGPLAANAPVSAETAFALAA